MAAVQSDPPPDKRSFFFALTADQREFQFPGDSKQRLSLSMLSLGFGARDEVHVLEAEGAQGGGGNAKLVTQTTAMLGVHPSLPAVPLTTVLTPPVTFRLRSGPGPLYVSGSRLFLEAAPALNIPKTYEEPAQSRAQVSSEADMDPLFANTLQYRTAEDIANHGGEVSNKYNATLNTKNEESPERRDLNMLADLDRTVGKVKAEIMESMRKGVKLSDVQLKFERFLKHSHNVTDPYLVNELWKWRLSLK